jgi:hypothetical protein
LRTVRQVQERHSGNKTLLNILLFLSSLNAHLPSIFGEPGGEKAGLLPRSIEYLFDIIERNDNKCKVGAQNTNLLSNSFL